MRRVQRSIMMWLSVLLSAFVVIAQDMDACLALVDTAVRNADELCETIEPNHACFAHGGVTVEGVDGAVITFSEPGDIVSLADISSLTLTPMDADATEWGMVVIRVQASMETDTTPATIVAYGDVEISDITPTMATFTARTGIEDYPCEGAPESALLIDTPEDAGEVSFILNELFELSFQSTGVVNVDTSRTRLEDLNFNLIVLLGQIQAAVVEGEISEEEALDMSATAVAAASKVIRLEAGELSTSDLTVNEQVYAKSLLGLNRVTPALGEQVAAVVSDFIRRAEVPSASNTDDSSTDETGIDCSITANPNGPIVPRDGLWLLNFEDAGVVAEVNIEFDLSGNDFTMTFVEVGQGITIALTEIQESGSTVYYGITDEPTQVSTEGKIVEAIGYTTVTVNSEIEAVILAEEYYDGEINVSDIGSMRLIGC